ncbi:hypothetical protein [Paenibacillus sanguinis]|uniref:hypothetical protein n=1 Tax=Paenibacillus sanguinis TaxID=225906 RepID=UPI0003647D8C|nr:hypothetical protein [Paenibacillus sanguinis]
MTAFTNPTEPISRLFALLGHVVLPVAIRPVAIISGLTDREVGIVLCGSPDYAVIDGQIFIRDPFQQNMEEMERHLWEVITVFDADQLYREEHCAFSCAAGQHIHTFIEIEHEEELAWQE